MTVFTPRFVLRAALIGVLALGLAACGRKGPLDPPPGAAVEGAEQRPASSGPFGMPMGGSGGSSNNVDMLEAPKGPKKPIILDGLLN